MPKAAVDEDNLFSAPEHDVWLTGQSFVMQAIAIPKVPKHFSHAQFRRGIDAFYPAHRLAPGQGAANRLWGIFHHLCLSVPHTAEKFSGLSQEAVLKKKQRQGGRNMGYVNTQRDHRVAAGGA